MILVVEDEQGARDAMCEILEDAGFSAVAAENGLRALESMSTAGTPKLIMLDLAMPVMDGWTFLARIEQRPELSEVPVIVMSADLNARRLRSQHSVNVKEVLVKPIDVTRMIELARHYTSKNLSNNHHG